jgi:hypothetical protein
MRSAITRLLHALGRHDDPHTQVYHRRTYGVNVYWIWRCITCGRVTRAYCTTDLSAAGAP